MALAAAWLDASQDPIVGRTCVLDERGRCILQAAAAGRARRCTAPTQQPEDTLADVASGVQQVFRLLRGRGHAERERQDHRGQDRGLTQFYREQQGSTFKSQDVWVLLRHSPKWLDKMTAKRNQKRRAGRLPKRPRRMNAPQNVPITADELLPELTAREPDGADDQNVPVAGWSAALDCKMHAP
ncbi:hypothetical protein PR003_g5882 [Phytophthora rubi]|uniref:No apical meristem-associated C-terminal domain-containing protein n=1 Tax=Phytophthora rubi TaxID=129364 RepID=A0A6A3LN77_9STRA|nr:hypothetical protein PR001_g14345 [Phytophthora rubi]KAE9349456.1 hypothetical protein PR003_g5882 [Phytophthora rubi]